MQIEVDLFRFRDSSPNSTEISPHTELLFSREKGIVFLLLQTLIAMHILKLAFEV